MISSQAWPEIPAVRTAYKLSTHVCTSAYFISVFLRLVDSSFGSVRISEGNFFLSVTLNKKTVTF